MSRLPLLSLLFLSACIPGMDLGALLGQVGQTAGQIQQQSRAEEERRRWEAEERRRQEAIAQQRAALEEQRRQAAEAERQRMALLAAQAEQRRAEAEAQRANEERLRAEAVARAQAFQREQRLERCATERTSDLAAITVDSGSLAPPAVAVLPGCEPHARRLVDAVRRHEELIGHFSGGLAEAAEVKYQGCITERGGEAQELIGLRMQHAATQAALIQCNTEVKERIAEERRAVAEARRVQAQAARAEAAANARRAAARAARPPTPAPAPVPAPAPAPAPVKSIEAESEEDYEGPVGSFRWRGGGRHFHK